MIFRENESYGTSDRSTFDLILWVCFLFFVVACRRVLLCAANLMSGYCIEVVRSLWYALLLLLLPFDSVSVNFAQVGVEIGLTGESVWD